MFLETIQDMTCPWCFIGKRRLDRALAMTPGLAVRRRWRSFQLDPGIGRGGTPFRVHVAARFGGRSHAERLFDTVTRAGLAEGIAFDFAAIERIPNTRDAHRLIRYAREIEADRRSGGVPIDGMVVDALFSAHFESGRDIGVIDTLADIAAECGLDGDAAFDFLAGDGAYDIVMAEDRDLRRRGFSAVPCTIIDGLYALSGAQAPECYLPLFDMVQEQARQQLPADRAASEVPLPA